MIFVHIWIYAFYLFLEIFLQVVCTKLFLQLNSFWNIYILFEYLLSRYCNCNLFLFYKYNYTYSYTCIKIRTVQIYTISSIDHICVVLTQCFLPRSKFSIIFRRKGNFCVANTWICAHLVFTSIFKWNRSDMDLCK